MLKEKNKPILLIDSINIGDILTIRYSDRNRFNHIKHVRGKVDDKLITRRWNKFKQNWLYEVIEQEFITVNYPEFLTIKRRRKTLK